MRLINADALEVVTAKVPKDMDVKSYMTGMEYVLVQIDAMPTIEERKTGAWIKRTGLYEIGYRCSECGAFSITETPYCPVCGTDMRGEADDS